MDQDEFETALAAQVAETEETEEASEEEPEAEAVADEPEDEPEDEGETEDPEGPVYPEAIQAYIDKYGGDPVKALEAAVHAQETIGRQGNELGELRRMVEEIRDRPEPQRAPQAPVVPSDLQEAIDANPQGVVEWAIQTENGPAYEAAMAEWYDQDARAASRFERAMERELLKQELTGQIQPELDSVREQQKARAVSDAHRALSQKYPDFQNVLETATEADLAGIDRDLLAQAQNTNPAAALELVYRWVRAGREQQAAQQAERTEKGRQAKREAAVVSGDGNNPQPEKTTMDKLREAMLAPEPQSVHHGLTSE